MLKRLSGFETWPQLRHELYGYARTRIITPLVRKAVKMAFYNPFVAKVVNGDGEVVQTVYGHNDIVDQGMNDLLDAYFRLGITGPVWYMGLIDGVSTQTLSNSDVAGTHAGWDFNGNFTGGPDRPSWTGSLAAAASRSISNSTTIDFAFTTTQTIHGIAIIDHATSDTASEILWSTAPFSTEVTVNNGDTLKITYTVSG
jgi:hypothetical protein